jgi:hypothetical protein
MSDSLWMLNRFYCLRLLDGNSTKVWRVSNLGTPGKQASPSRASSMKQRSNGPIGPTDGRVASSVQ